ncbi:GNAT family N-acetyltransferase [Ornithinibacillus sp. L9]|uniref:GNAT family N-acetyltransferase n=1 Tax=Ornithinibacillus caprae TaxID=2678566 RepID=A0A6N8FN38_9BACI|nr:GNAT family N-acetyltransferase [Ornithinibacillus caprae]MUK90621.1 GNAT family N-acetyltransferase [Ornithinibacillus caprae]
MKVIKDNNIRLRPIRLPEDLPIALPWYQDEEVLYFSEGVGTSAYGLPTIERMYKYLTTVGEVYLIEVHDRHNWLPVGDVTLSKDMIPIVIGDQDYRGKGIGKRVIKLLIEQAKEFNWEQIKVNKVYEYNVASRKLFEGLGFKQTATNVDDSRRKYYSYELKLE